ncbi:MAG: nucleoside deaminase [Cyanobacteria bacterium P01_F01_bin.153]
MGNSARQWFGLNRDWLDPNHPIHAQGMAIAQKEADLAAQKGDVPVGATILNSQGHPIGRGHNQKHALGDPTAHAEILALREVGRSRQNWHLNDCALYVTLEPCPMCAGALVQGRIGLLVFGVPEPKSGAITSIMNLATQPWSNHYFPVIAGVNAVQCRLQLADWFVHKRNSATDTPETEKSPTETGEP